MNAAWTAAAKEAVAANDSRIRRDLPASAAPSRIDAFLRQARFDRPTLVMDVDAVEARYDALSAGLTEGGAPTHVHYAVKANPHPEIIRRLVARGCRFDAASRGEIDLCLSEGARPEHISFGNTIKRISDIAYAFARGVRLFAVDAEEELLKIAEAAPGASVYVRMLIEHSEADWPLSRKFGCGHPEALRLMGLAAAVGLHPVGLSFHVGSQTREPRMWAGALDAAAELWADAAAQGTPLTLLNLGGGFPAFYGEEIPTHRDYAAEVMRMVRSRFGDEPQYIMAEPGRGLVAEAGVIAAEVLLVSKKRQDDLARWVYLDIGKFSGLAETMDEAIRYQIETSADGDDTGPCVLAGPSCDSADVLYEKRPIQLPLSLAAGDKVRILCCGAYTTTYSSVGFNGFPPLDVICL